MVAAEVDPCGRNGVAAAVWQRRQTAAAGQGRPWVINQRVVRACVRVRRPGVLTFAAISEVGVGGRRVDGGHCLNSHTSIQPIASYCFENSTDERSDGDTWLPSPTASPAFQASFNEQIKHIIRKLHAVFVQPQQQQDATLCGMIEHQMIFARPIDHIPDFDRLVS